MITFESRGEFRKMDKFLDFISRGAHISRTLTKYGEQGVAALAANTPQDTGLAATSWYYEVFNTKRSFGITWYNRDVEDGFPVVIQLQYGYATGTGGYVMGQNFINPALKPVFDRIANEVWKAVTSA